MHQGLREDVFLCYLYRFYVFTLFNNHSTSCIIELSRSNKFGMTITLRFFYSLCTFLKCTRVGYKDVVSCKVTTLYIDKSCILPNVTI